MKKVLLTGAYRWTDEKIKAVKSLGYKTNFVQDERIPLECDVSEFDAVVCNGLFLYNDIEKFTSLKFIQATSAGLDRIPLDYVSEKKIELYNARGVYSVPMAEWAIMRTLEIYKNAKIMYDNQRDRLWQKQRSLLEISEKTVLIVGTGSVGTEVAKRFSAFDAEIIGADIFENKSELYDRCVLVNDIDSVLPECDIVVLTLPLTDDTRGMFNADKFSRMKDGAVFINVARGGVVNEKDLISALSSNKLLGAGLDVFENEPLDENSPLWTLDNVLISPHNSFVSDKTDERLFKVILNNLKAFADKS